MKKKPEVGKLIFDLAAFLVSSARGCLDEPPAYASFRLLEALERIIELQSKLPCVGENNFMEKLRSEVEKNKFLVLRDPEGFKAFLDRLLREVAREALKRG